MVGASCVLITGKMQVVPGFVYVKNHTISSKKLSFHRGQYNGQVLS